MKSDNPGLEIWEYQPPLLLDQVAPVQNTFYSFGEIENARIYNIGVNVEDANETLEIQMTADGELISSQGFAATHSTNYTVYLRGNAILLLDQVLISATDVDTMRRSYLMEGRNIEVELRKTTALGAGDLMGIVIWGKRKNA